MRKASIGITPEGVPSIGLCALAALVFACLKLWFPAVLFLAATLFCVNFFRDPERVIPSKAKVAVSPADGKVIKIYRAPDPFTGEMRQCICIFMNVFNVHVNRSPVAGTVTGINYHQGLFLNASFDKASEDNERCSYQLRDAEGQIWSMVQIAGFVARRIVCRVDEGEELQRGERFGMIKFGSRVDLYLPEGMRPAVHVGETVLAGVNILAEAAPEA